GHPQGTVADHIELILRNVDDIAIDLFDRERLRLVALIHDAFKFREDAGQPRVGANHHAMIARHFAERYIDDSELLEVIELHDEAYDSWTQGQVEGDWPLALARAQRLIDRLGVSLGFYLRFYRADTVTGFKNKAPLEWFESVRVL